MSLYWPINDGPLPRVKGLKKPEVVKSFPMYLKLISNYCFWFLNTGYSFNQQTVPSTFNFGGGGNNGSTSPFSRWNVYFVQPSLSLDDSYYYSMRVFFLLFNTIIFWFVIVVYFWPFFFVKKIPELSNRIFLLIMYQLEIVPFLYGKGLLLLHLFSLSSVVAFRLCLGRYHF